MDIELMAVSFHAYSGLCEAFGGITPQMEKNLFYICSDSKNRTNQLRILGTEAHRVNDSGTMRRLLLVGRSCLRANRDSEKEIPYFYQLISVPSHMV